MPPEIAFVALGSNLGERFAYIEMARRALDETAGLVVVGASHIYETEPEGPGPQGPYLNAVLALRSDLSPDDLLTRMLEIERQAGRTRGRDEARWGPRTLDLDLLMQGDRCIELPGLELPHPRLHLRGFVLEPLVELTGDDRVHPRLGQPLGHYRERIRRPERVRPWSAAAGWQVGLWAEPPPPPPAAREPTAARGNT